MTLVINCLRKALKPPATNLLIPALCENFDRHTHTVLCLLIIFIKLLIIFFINLFAKASHFPYIYKII
jgi:hypothetical protein